jgi:threonine dehydratase
VQPPRHASVEVYNHGSSEFQSRDVNPDRESDTQLVSLEDIRSAASRVSAIARVTPLLDVSALARRPLHLKCENLQPGGAFKIRGAYNMVAQLSEDQRRRGVITFSSGNHGQAMALAARELGAPAVVVMPTTAPRVKIEGVKGFGAEVIFAGTTSTARRERAESEARARGLTMVPPFDDAAIIAGQGTAGLEILDQLPDVAAVLAPIGGGGLAAGVAAAIKLSRPDVMVIGVEPEGSAAMKASVDAGHPVTLSSTTSVADGLLPLRPGDLTFAHVQRFVDQVVTVADGAIIDAVLWLLANTKMVVEPSGAATLAAVLSGQVEMAGPIVAIVSGGNVDRERLDEFRRSRQASA